MDRRDYYARHPSLLYGEFCEDKMTIQFIEYNQDGDEEVEIEHTIRATFTVCETCRGKGTHVNPSIDSRGLTREDFDDDPDFAEAYWSGAYDQSCNECGGKRVVPEPVDDKSDAYNLYMKIVEEKQNDYYYEESERRAECGYY